MYFFILSSNSLCLLFVIGSVLCRPPLAPLLIISTYPLSARCGLKSKLSLVRNPKWSCSNNASAMRGCSWRIVFIISSGSTPLSDQVLGSWAIELRLIGKSNSSRYLSIVFKRLSFPIHLIKVFR